ncbi:glycan-binding surface protein [Adhaeribacter radiodurans]|uniref:Surface glycan-binding protein B xyloglucan binding domain-containing protein n=1 Tax=Adhaeribacter radiodurans TaxID=2745197 RepID=A0A7L7L2R2_9BACT|nr:glycan-binding surface protein [Adhaeribacter radiodurans]QMU26739.1 hypothetical protein HUW48_01230 [Adhaeribacter radiodurans]
MNRISFLILFFLVGMLYSCQEEDPTEPAKAKAAPVIEAVRSMNPAKADSTFTQSTLGSTIVIKGQNLENAQYISFNGYNASFNSAYASKNYLIVTIPQLTPTVATSATVSNKLIVGNSKGESTYDFTVLPPAPIIEAMSNEYVKAGETLTLYGKYFYFVKGVTFPGGAEGTNLTASPDGLTLNVTVPTVVNPAQGNVVVTTESGKSAANGKTKLYSVGMVGNFDDKNPFGWGIPADNITNSASGITPIDGKFGLINMALPGAYGWSNDKVINLADWGGAQIFPTEPASIYKLEDPIANYEARMEVAVANIASLEGIQLQVMTQEATDKEITANVNLKDFVRSKDGKWYTVAVPLANLVNGSTKLAKYGDLLKGNKSGVKTYRVVIVNGNTADVPATIAIDNMRIVNAVQ